MLAFHTALITLRSSAIMEDAFCIRIGLHAGRGYHATGANDGLPPDPGMLEFGSPGHLLRNIFLKRRPIDLFGSLDLVVVQGKD